MHKSVQESQTRIKIRNFFGFWVRTLCQAHQETFREFCNSARAKLLLILLKFYFKLNYTMKIKPDTANNFRQIIQITNLDLCTALEDLSRISLVSEYLETVNKVFPGALHKCPYSVKLVHVLARKFYFNNYFSLLSFTTGHMARDGIYTTTQQLTRFQTDSSDTPS